MSDMTHVFENDSERVTNVFSLTFLEERKQRSHTNKTLSPPFLAILAYFPSDILVITVIARNIRNSVGSLFFRKRILRFGNIGIYVPNLGILLSRKNNEPTLLILFRACVYRTDQTSVCYTFEGASKRSSFAKREIQLCRSTHA